ncbi:MAG: carbohydrate ABC transporter permease [Anaerolineae bacterium]|nr:carbohydrate ABC transporter permease [Anaerolineae bacterium]
MVSTSLKTDPQVYRIPSPWIPNPARWRNYIEAMTIVPFGKFFLNTIKYAILVTIGTVLSSTLVAYGFSRVQWKGRDAVFFLCLATMMIPGQVRMIPLYIVFSKIGWVNSYKPLIIPSFFAAAYDVFLLRQFFLTIPLELSDAARIDGASELTILGRVVIPLAKPAMAVVALFTIMGAWDNYLGPLIYLTDREQYPIALGLQMLRTTTPSFYMELQWPRLMAASAVTIFPIILLYFFTQRTFVEGISITGIKG